MPRRLTLSQDFDKQISSQDGVVARYQAVHAGMTAAAITHRLAERHWRALLPGVYLTTSGAATRRQRSIAALLYCGDASAIDAADACAFYGLTAVPVDESLIHIVTPWGASARSRHFLRVRRTTSPILTRRAGVLRYAEPGQAVIAAARLCRTEREVIALLSEAVQKRLVDEQQLLRAHVQATPRNARLTDAALDAVRGGSRSAPEAAFRQLAEASTLLPPLLYNPLLRLPDGRQVSPDALDVDAGLVHEVNGRQHHARLDLFEEMQQRHDAMTVAGLIVMHNSGRRIFRDGRAVIREFEQCHVRYAGRGLPRGVEIVRTAAI
jgi:hypothetical protein